MWWAAAVLLIFAYPVAFGPASYAVIRGWLPQRLFFKLYRPLYRVLGDEPGLLLRYETWWVELGMKHDGWPRRDIEQSQESPSN
jgi:hypothetical protein